MTTNEQVKVSTISAGLANVERDGRRVGQVRKGTHIWQDGNTQRIHHDAGWYAVPMGMLSIAHPEQNGARWFATRREAAESL